MAWDIRDKRELLQLAPAPAMQTRLLLSCPFQDVLKGEGRELGAGPLIELVLKFHPVGIRKGKKTQIEISEAGGQEQGAEHHGNQMAY